MNSRNISEMDQAALKSLMKKYSTKKLIDFLQENEPQEVLEITDYSLGRVNKKLTEHKNQCKKLVIKFRGHDAAVFSFFGQENLKRYMESYGDYDLPNQFVEFPSILSANKALEKTEQIVIYFPFVLFQHEIFNHWNEILSKKRKATIIVQRLESRRNFDSKIDVHEENWRYSSN